MMMMQYDAMMMSYDAKKNIKEKGHTWDVTTCPSSKESRPEIPKES
jgi:hypothetical protein